MQTLDPDRRSEWYEYIWSSPMYSGWHWLQWSFDQVRSSGAEAPAAVLILDALVRCDDVMPGFAKDMIDRLATFGGSDRDQNDYEAIRQWLSEVLVIHHFATWPWPGGASFEHEPTTSRGGANPEMVVRCSDFSLGIEVKCPDLRVHRAARFNNDGQLLARLETNPLSDIGNVTLPRDNPMKDFLRSCESKFAQFRDDGSFHTLLVVVWDDYVNEPLSTLLSPASGLFTEQSFARDEGSGRVSFPSTDGVVLLRHQHQFVEGLAGRPPIDQREHFLDYGVLGQFPHNAIIANPDGRGLPADVIDATQSVEPAHQWGAEYVPGEIVLWFGG